MDKAKNTVMKGLGKSTTDTSEHGNANHQHRSSDGLNITPNVSSSLGGSASSRTPAEVVAQSMSASGGGVAGRITKGPGGLSHVGEPKGGSKPSV